MDRIKNMKQGLSLHLTGTIFRVALLCLGMVGWQLPLRAATPIATPSSPTTATPAPANTAAPPPVLLEFVKNLDAAASRKDLGAAMQYFSANLTHSDGLDNKTYSEALKAFWQNTPSVQYQTQIDSWQLQGPNQYLMETTTTIRGVQKAAERDMTLESTVRSRTTIIDQKITNQTILSEQTRLSAGDKAPNVQINLPEQVTVGQSFNFDAIVKDPLGEDLLLGAALEESVTPDRYLQPAAVTLEPLSAGGLFKIGKAPQQPGRKWISAILIQSSGMAIVSQRLNVVPSNSAASPSSR
ncbi:MAG: nuclear transport factor 2 family protein [Thermosynechococcaceae cyanobacterium]